MEPSTTPLAPTAAAEGRVRAAEDRLALLSSLLHRLEEAAENDGLVVDKPPDTHQSQLVRVRLGMASSLFTALRAKHSATANHSFRVALTVSSWATAEKLNDDLRDAIEIAALLHDVGKIGVPDEILMKPGKLTAEETLSMERSRLIGHDIVSQCCDDQLITDSMQYANAWYDGSKHGFDKTGNHLPLGARMLAIADAFDSMTTEHVYRKAMSRERAVAELCACAGTQFDPDLVKQFCDLVAQEAGAFHPQVARRWLQDLSAEKSNAHWAAQHPVPIPEVKTRDEDFQEQLVDSMCDGVIFVDAQLKILRWNGAAERMTGISVASVADKYWSPSLVRLRDDVGRLVSDTDCPARLALASGAKSLGRFSLGTRLNDRVNVDLQVSPVLGDNGTPHGATLVLHDVSSQASLEERVQNLHERASRDGLTKAANRAEFTRIFPTFIDSHLKQGRPCSLIICDIDHFKKINDTYGHQAGDEALILFASILERQARAGDWVFRYGGEEFVLLCAECDNATATRRADEIRRRVANTPMPTLGNRCITASFGVTEIQGGDTPKTFLNRADRALLQAKDAGRNLVVQLGTGIVAESKTKDRRSWLNWFSSPAGEILLERTVITVVPLKVTTEKLRGFVSDHHAQLNKVDENRVSLTIDSQFIPNVRRNSDRTVPFVIELAFDEKQLPVEGRANATALRTLIHVTIRPKRQRDRRQRDAIERARQILFSLKSYLMAQDYDGEERVGSTEQQSDSLLGSSKQLIQNWLGVNSSTPDSVQ